MLSREDKEYDVALHTSNHFVGFSFEANFARENIRMFHAPNNR